MDITWHLELLNAFLLVVSVDTIVITFISNLFRMNGTSSFTLFTRTRNKMVTSTRFDLKLNLASFAPQKATFSSHHLLLLSHGQLNHYLRTKRKTKSI
ncbi:hypothetical protein BJV82DRAFT_602785 [Fennellomyces sp. T-0311]|nr:hypothetical protein BJV82DRAFT_602785 [Fennellomyces sp. T-0311]